MLIDSHCHIFTNRIVENVTDKPAMVGQLKLNTQGALQRLDPEALGRSAQANGLDLCMLLPTASPDRVVTENDRFIGMALRFPRLRTLATLHPAMQGLADEIRRMFDQGINGFKFSSFSQRFDLASQEVETMLKEISRLALGSKVAPVLVLDTFVTADLHFGADIDHLTTPGKLVALAHRHPGINFVGAHMGGLLADFDELVASLVPAPNVYLDTANAAHTLEEDQFVRLLEIHGPSHILFGTDWPWFEHCNEIPKIESLLARAGYDEDGRAAVFGGNARRILGF